MRPSRLRSALVVALISVPLAGCTDEKIVFRDRVLFEDPPSAAQGFLGYSASEDKLVVCGNCHFGIQRQWEGTAHADAWAGLQDSGQAQAFCEGCHTVNELGNVAEGAGGFLAAPDERYHDVQCESCHGPGLGHVLDPDGIQPLAPVSVGADLTTGCGECHQGTHHPFIEEWEQSAHAGVLDYPAGRPECQSCHTGQGALRAFGVKADYLEKGSDTHLPITCGVCHDPHNGTFEGQLRFPVVNASIEEHLCAQCHNRRTSPDPESAQGLAPHAPEAALLVGDAGWFPPNLNVDQRQIFGTHGSEANPGLCATCHVNAFEVTDQATGAFVFQATGHLFQAIPCLTEEGLPTAEDCEINTTTRSFQGCATSGCHGSEQAAYSALVTSTNRIASLATELIALLEVVDPNLTGAGGAIDARDGVFTTAEGAYFNYRLAAFGGTDRVDPRGTYAGSATHNPFLMENLLIASVDAVEAEYALAASETASIDAHPLTARERNAQR